VDRFGSGELSVRAGSRRRDEIGNLSRTFDRMAERIATLLTAERRLLQDISHELRSPLTRANVSLELIRRGNTDAVERMQSDLNLLNTLIGQILTLTRLQTRADHMEVPVNLRSILESVAEDARFEVEEDGKSVVISRADDCWLKGDPALLRSCIENVVRNAIHYTKPSTEVSLSLELVGHGSEAARILVSDHGEGVPPEALDHIFEAFYRVTEAREHKTGGTGLGLSIAQKIVIAHGGSIRALNRPGGGLDIEIQFPLRECKSPAALCAYT